MSGSTLERFLEQSPLARRARAEARIVIRRFTAPPARVEHALESGRMRVEAEPICELVVGGQVLARGEIVSEDGTYRFRVTEVME